MSGYADNASHVRDLGARVLKAQIASIEDVAELQRRASTDPIDEVYARAERAIRDFEAYCDALGNKPMTHDRPFASMTGISAAAAHRRGDDALEGTSTMDQQVAAAGAVSDLDLAARRYTVTIHKETPRAGPRAALRSALGLRASTGGGHGPVEGALMVESLLTARRLIEAVAKRDPAGARLSKLEAWMRSEVEITVPGRVDERHRLSMATLLQGLQAGSPSFCPSEQLATVCEENRRKMTGA
jgi:hypothetical protein